MYIFLYIFNNKKQEASFGTLKANDKKYLSLLRERLGDIAVSQINNTAEWLQSPESTFTFELLRTAKLERKNRAMKRRKNLDDSRDERLRKLIRIESSDESNESETD